MRKIRLQIQLDEDQLREVDRRAAAAGQSRSAFVRAAVDQRLANGSTPSRQELWERSLAAVGAFSSGRSDISARHTEFVADAYWEDHLRSTGQEHRLEETD